MTRLLKTAAAAAAFLALQPALADTVRIESFSNGSRSLKYDVPGTNGNTSAGQFQGLHNGASFQTYCVDLFQSFQWNTNHTDYNPVDGVDHWGAQKAGDLGRLLTYIGAGVPANRDISALNQAAVWEVVNETSRNYGFASGNALFASSNATTQALLNTFDWAAAMNTVSIYDVNVLVSAKHQDFLTLTPVPEPGTYALIAMGLAAVGFVARRRRSH